MPSSKPHRVFAPRVKSSRKIINGHEVHSFWPSKSMTGVSPKQPEQPKQSERKVHLGAVGCVDHSKNSLIAAIKIVLERRKTKTEEHELDWSSSGVSKPASASVHDDDEEARWIAFIDDMNNLL